MKTYVEPAFPSDSSSDIYAPHIGMSLRDYMATKAMQGFCASKAFSDSTPEQIAIMAYQQADAMLRIRK